MPADQHTAESVTVEADENGFELHITTEDGLFVFNVQAVASDLYREVYNRVLPWLYERDRAAVDAFRHVTVDDGHSRHAELWDSREKGA